MSVHTCIVRMNAGEIVGNASGGLDAGVCMAVAVRVRYPNTYASRYSRPLSQPAPPTRTRTEESTALHYESGVSLFERECDEKDTPTISGEIHTVGYVTSPHHLIVTLQRTKT